MGSRDHVCTLGLYPIGRVRKIAVGKGRPSTCHLIIGRSPLSLTTQVTDQWEFAGQVPEWSDSEAPAQVGTSDLPVIKWQVLGLPFSTAIFRTLPIVISLCIEHHPKLSMFSAPQLPIMQRNCDVTNSFQAFLARVRFSFGHQSNWCTSICKQKYYCT